MKNQKFKQLNGKIKKSNSKCYISIILLSLLAFSILALTNKSEKKNVQKQEKSENTEKKENNETTKINQHKENNQNTKNTQISVNKQNLKNNQSESKSDNTQNISKSEKIQNSQEAPKTENKTNSENIKEASTPENSSNPKLQSVYNSYKKYENRHFRDKLKNKYKIKKLYLRSDLTYTQGLFFLKNKLYESGGLFSKSSFLSREKINFNLKTLKKKKIAQNNYFGEGADFYIKNGKVYFYQLTWKNRKIIERDENFEILREIELPKKIQEGWGITHDPENPSIFFISDGTNIIYECDVERDFHVIKEHEIFHKNREVDYLNELEFFFGKVYANVYPSNYMVELDLEKGNLKRIFDFLELKNIAEKIMRDLRGRGLKEYDEVFNGIAYNWESGEILVTGKNWPVFFEIEFLN